MDSKCLLERKTNELSKPKSPDDYCRLGVTQRIVAAHIYVLMWLLFKIDPYGILTLWLLNTIRLALVFLIPAVIGYGLVLILIEGLTILNQMLEILLDVVFNLLILCAIASGAYYLFSAKR